VTTTIQPAPPTRLALLDPPRSRLRPVVWFAAAGFAYLAVAGFGWTRWLFSGNLTSTPNGPSEIPGYAAFAVRAWEVLSLLIAGMTVYHWGIKPWKRAGHITTDGILIVAYATLFFLDPTVNYSQFSFAYNTHLLNFGSWLNWVPGSLVPHSGAFPEPVLLIGAMYTWGFLLPSILGCVVLRKARQRWPQLSYVGLFAILFMTFMAVDFVIEIGLFVLPQIWAYPASIRSVTLFAGTQFQFPLYEPPLMAFVFCGVTALRWFVDDRGRTVAERGIDEVRVSAGAKVTLRLLATVGCTGMIVAATYLLPWQWFATHADSFPEKMPSYLLDGLCGVGTTYPCPGPGVPIFRPDSPPTGPYPIR